MSGKSRRPFRTATQPVTHRSAAPVVTHAAGRWSGGLLAAGLFCFAVLSRVLPFWREMVEGGRVLVTDPDACYHLRRAEWIARNFPDLGLFDPYVNHPFGAQVIWPPLYDLLLGGLIRLFPQSSGAPGASIPVGLLPPVLFGLTVLAVFALARRLSPGSRLFPGLAAGLVPCIWAIAPYTRFGNLDHHAAEYLLAILFLLTFSNGLERCASGTGALRAAWLPGLVLGAALLVQLTLIVLIPFPLASLLLLRGKPRQAAGFAVALTGIAGLIVGPFALLYHAAGAPIRHYQFGLFQALLLLAAFCVMLGVRWAVAKGALVRRIFPFILMMLPAAALLHVMAGALRGGIGYLFRQSGWIAHIGESRSPFAGGWNGVLEVLLTASPLILLLPVALYRLARQGWQGNIRRGILFFALAGFGLLGSLQARFLPHLCLLLGVAALVALEPLFNRAQRGVAHAFFAFSLGALVLFPSRNLWRQPEESRLEFDRARGVLDALAKETPPTRSLQAAQGKPEYGVLAEWSYGHYIQYYGRRPAVADNFGDYLNDLQSVSRFFLAREEDDAVAVLQRVNARYVLVGDLPSTLSGLNLDDEEMARYVAHTDRLSRGQGRVEFTNEILDTVLYRLAWRFGGGLNHPAGGYIPPLGHFRLVAESAATDSLSGGALLMPHVKLFEQVSGARLRLSGLKPAQTGSLLLWILSPRGSRFPLYYRLLADRRGEAQLTLPYPTAASAGRSRISESEFSLGDAAWRLPEISEAAIAAGAEFPLAAESVRPDSGRAKSTVPRSVPAR